MAHKNNDCSLIDYSQLWLPDVPKIFEPGEYLWRVPITYKTSTQPTSTLVGNIGFKIEVFSKADIPENAYDYQCFDAPPDEDGWQPVGKCHPTEEECAKACGPWWCYRKLELRLANRKKLLPRLR